MRILVTGGAGFIGSNFVWYLLGLGHEVMVYDAFTYAGRPENLPSSVKVVRGDIVDKDKLFSVAREFQPDIIVNFAAETHVDRSIRDPEPFIRTNIYGVYTLLEVVRRIDTRLIHVSTDEVYGDLEGREPASEDTVLRPSNPYSATKASGDMLLMAYWRTYNIDASIVRPSNNYGPRQHPEKLIPKTIIRAVHGLPVIVHGNGSQRRDWLYVEDTCRAIWLVAEKGRPGEIYNVPGFNERSVLEVVEKILELLNKLEALFTSRVIGRARIEGT
ncbi:dTDP-glucose 4,6-dehydratase [Vulcanisaeta sp. JCM 16159]|uniref:dTDP-glucose 4,6-dehydratase n=1 Tax=Vulcanisaeta sp. JCM 16159 TaxID=1295371 RepID=UPI000AA32AFF|nr:dTDP-glucose 4,6-dehydratase [Vulcanisaeta sp. JCM 16159]